MDLEGDEAASLMEKEKRKLQGDLKGCKAELAKLRKLLKDLEREQVKQMAKAHQKLDQLAQKDISSTSQASVPTMGAIGYLESCFAVKNGTPRQGSICPTSKAKIGRAHV